MDKIQEIIERVSINEILRRYWGEPDRSGRYKCVFHNGKDNNMVALDGNCYCFVCNESGNAINVVRTIFNCSTPQAISKIDDDFGLGLCKPLTAEQKKAYAERKKEKERERKRQEELEKFEKECLDKIAEKLRIADEYIEEKSFKGEVGSVEMYHYTDTIEYKMFLKAVERRRWLEWLWCIISGDKRYLVEEDFCALHGTDKVGILRKVYKGEIEI